MTQSAGGPHSSFQPIIQMEGAIHTGSLQVSLLSPCSPGQVCAVSRASYLSLTSHGSQIVICCRGSQTWKKKSSAALRHNRKSHKASDVRCSGCYLGGNDGQRRFFFFFLSVRVCVVTNKTSSLTGVRYCLYFSLWVASFHDSLKLIIIDLMCDLKRHCSNSQVSII